MRHSPFAVVSPFILACALAIPATAQFPTPASDVPLDVRGEVVDEHGAPIVGAAFYRGNLHDATLIGKPQEPLARTDANGRLRVTIPATPVGVTRATTGRFEAPGRASRWVRIRGITSAETVDLGRVVLPKGVSITGLVRGSDGKPVAGARVVAVDVMASTHLRAANASSEGQFQAGAIADAKGIFRLHGVVRRGVTVTVRAPGYHLGQVNFANTMRPLVVMLNKGGFVSGKVVDDTGKPVAARVNVKYEQGIDPGGARETAADGTFKVNLSFPGRYRVAVIGKVAMSVNWTDSDVLSGPKDGLKLTLDGGKEGKQIVVNVVDQATGEKVSKIRAVAYWTNPQIFQFSAYLLEMQLKMSGRSEIEPGKVILPGPGPKQPSTGGILVRAEGYAPHTITDAEYDEEEAEENIFTVKLAKEATISGVVVDKDTGKPVRGAIVSAVKKVQNNNAGNIFFAGATRMASGPTFETDAAGRFKVTQLSGGKYDLQVTHPNRPAARKKRITLEAGASEADVSVKIAAGVKVTGKLVGLEIGKGWMIRLGGAQTANPLAQLGMGVATSSGQSPLSAGGEKPIGADGAFEFAGLAKGSYPLMLRVPLGDGSGGYVNVTLPAVRVRTEDVVKEVDISERMPATIHGKVEFTGAALPPGRLLLVAEKKAGANQFSFNGLGNRLAGTSCLVGRDGTYRLPVAKGSYRVLAIDLATGALLHQGEEYVRVTAGEKSAQKVKIQLALVRVAIQQGEDVKATRLQINVKHPADGQNAQMMAFLQAQRNYDYGNGLAIAPGVKEIELFLPPLDVELKARSLRHNIDSTLQQRTSPPAGSLEFRPVVGQSSHVKLKIE